MVGTTKLDQLFTPKSYGCWITLDEREVTRLATTAGEEVNIRGLGQRNMTGEASQLLRNMIAAARSELFKPDMAVPSMRAVHAFERSLLSIGAWVLAAALELPKRWVCPPLRLNAIREEIRAEENATVSIGDLAAKYGIWHLSRFSTDYRRLFGQ
jgi:hypothetical protein